MGVLNDDSSKDLKKDMAKDIQQDGPNAAKAAKTTEQTKAVAIPVDEHTGYDRDLFEDFQPKWSDDRIGTEKMETRYHDKEMVLKVANGLCYDIFFRAEDVHRPDFDEIPDFFAPVLEEENKKPQQSESTESSKPLDSKRRNRTYILNPDEQEETKKSEKKEGKPSGRRRNQRNRSSKRKPRRRR